MYVTLQDGKLSILFFNFFLLLKPATNPRVFESVKHLKLYTLKSKYKALEDFNYIFSFVY
jgi:hypothetical protein